MAWIFVDKEGESGGMEKMRKQMRRNMRGGGGYRYPMMRHGDDGYEHGYRQGYKEGWEDHENEMMDDDMEYRRRRDSRGRYI